MVVALVLACTANGPVDTGDSDEPGLAFRAVTYNTGTTEGLVHDPSFDGYGPEQAAISDQRYGDGLAWGPAVEAVAAFLTAADPDVVAFQEVFDPAECAAIPEPERVGFVCEGWVEGDPSVAERVTGAGYAVVCHPGKPDKCVAVHERLGSVAGIDGVEVPGCGSGARVARVRVDGFGTIVSVHGNSGLSTDDQACRAAQVEAIFGPEGLASPSPVLVMGDLNTDPGRWASIDASAAAWAANVGGDGPFQWITEVGPDSEPTYQGIVAIDHVASDTWVGDCVTEGVSPGTSAVYGGVYFDHHPVVCDLREP